MRELVMAASQKKPIITMMEPDPKRGGVSMAEIKDELKEAVEQRFATWRLDCSHSAAELAHALFDGCIAVITWERLGHFMHVAKRQLASAILPAGSRPTYVEGEMIMTKLMLVRPPLKPQNAFHVYCSPQNVGARELIQELGAFFSFNIRMTTALDDLPKCDKVLIYLNGETWTRGAASEAFGEEMGRAMDAGVEILLAHEMPGAGQSDTAVDFGTFFTTTPRWLIERGIYRDIAVPIKAGMFRAPSMHTLARAIGAQGLEALLDECYDELSDAAANSAGRSEKHIMAQVQALKAGTFDAFSAVEEVQ